MPGLCQWCNGPEHAGSCDREALKEVIRQLRMLEAARSKLPGTNVIMIRSLVSHRDQKPRIDIQVGEIHTQMDVHAAVDVARNIFECAAGSYADGFIFNFMREKVGLDDNRAVQVIEDFRDYRETLAAEFTANQNERTDNG